MSEHICPLTEWVGRAHGTFWKVHLTGASRLLVHSITELNVRPELEHAGDPKWERSSLPTGSLLSGRQMQREPSAR